MHFILTPVGSAGDVLPFVALGRSLRERGHEAVLLANEHFQGVIEGSGLPFSRVGSKASYSSALENPDLWHPWRGARIVVQQMVAQTSEMFQKVMEQVRPGESVLLSSPGATGTPIVQEKMSLPMATLFLQPNSLYGVHGLIVTRTMKRLDWIPISLRRGLSALSSVLMDRLVRCPIDEIRAEIELPPVDHWTSAWRGKPSRAIGLFPDWFAPCPRDFSERARLSGFLFYSGEEVWDTPESLRDFLDAGPPPVIFMAGTANKQAHKLFAAAVEATKRLRRRAVILTAFREQVPAELPDDVALIDYAPLSDLLPRSAALVHHGGVGTAAQALAAGIPQLIVPFGLDQPANAIRVSDLGAGDFLPLNRVDERALGDKLASLLDNQEMGRVARRYAKKIAEQDALSETCDLVEKLETWSG